MQKKRVISCVLSDRERQEGLKNSQGWLKKEEGQTSSKSRQGKRRGVRGKVRREGFKIA